MPGTAVHQSRTAIANDDITGFIHPPSACAAKHLQQLVRGNIALHLTVEITRFRNHHGPHGKVDARRQTHRRHHHPQLPGFGEGFDDPGPLLIGQSAVVAPHPSRNHGREFLPQHLFLLTCKWKTVRHRQRARNLPGDFFRVPAVRGENQERSQPVHQNLRRQPRPITGQAFRRAAFQHFQGHLLQGHRTLLGPHHLRPPAQALQPCGHILGIGHASTQ